jgi:hypothetical protein
MYGNFLPTSLSVSVSVVSVQNNPCAVTIRWYILHPHVLYSASSPVPVTRYYNNCMRESHHNRSVRWNGYLSNEILIQLKPHIHRWCVRLFLFLFPYGTSHKQGCQLYPVWRGDTLSDKFPVNSPVSCLAWDLFSFKNTTVILAVRSERKLLACLCPQIDCQ